MQIAIKPEQSSTKVWELIELQGTLQFTQSHVEEFGVLDLSKVSFFFLIVLFHLKSVPTLNIGPAVLEGKSVKLHKPYALIEKDDVSFDQFYFIFLCVFVYLFIFIAVIRTTLDGTSKD